MLSFLKRIPGWFWALLPTFLGLSLGYLYLVIQIHDSYLPNQSSASVAQARERGILLRQYRLVPRTVRYENYEVAFGECWQEEQTQRTHVFIFFPRTVRQGRPLLLLTYRVRQLSPEPDSVPAPLLLLQAPDSADYADWSALRSAPTGLVAAQASFAPVAERAANDTLTFTISRRRERGAPPLLAAYPVQ